MDSPKAAQRYKRSNAKAKLSTRYREVMRRLFYCSYLHYFTLRNIVYVYYRCAKYFA